MKYVLTTIVAFLCSTMGFAQGDGSEATRAKMLVVFFSRAGENWQVGNVERGNTAIMVDYITELADVDTFQIVPVNPYPENYEECVNYVNNIEASDARPAYVGDFNSLSDYDTIFIGGPIWMGQPPKIIRTFLEAHQQELGGKTFVPFGTHGGSGVSSYRSMLSSYFPNATILESLGISGSSIRNASSRTTVASWLTRLGLGKQTTAISSIQADKANDGKAYKLDGTQYRRGKGVYIKDGEKYIAP